MKIALDAKFHDLVTSASASTGFGPIVTLGVIVTHNRGRNIGNIKRITPLLNFPHENAPDANFHDLVASPSEDINSSSIAHLFDHGAIMTSQKG